MTQKKKKKKKLGIFFAVLHMPFDCQSPQTPFLIHFPCVLDQGKNQDSNWGEGGGGSKFFIQEFEKNWNINTRG